MNEKMKIVLTLAVVVAMFACCVSLTTDDTAEATVEYEQVKATFNESEAVYLAPSGSAPDGLTPVYTNFVDAYNAVADHGVIYFCEDVEDNNYYRIGGTHSGNAVYLGGKSVMLSSYGNETYTWSFKSQSSENVAALAFNQNILIVENLNISTIDGMRSGAISVNSNGTVWLGPGSYIRSSVIGATSATDATINMVDDATIVADDSGLGIIANANIYGGTITVLNSQTEGILCIWVQPLTCTAEPSTPRMLQVVVI